MIDVFSIGIFHNSNWFLLKKMNIKNDPKSLPRETLRYKNTMSFPLCSLEKVSEASTKFDEEGTTAAEFIRMK